MHLKRFPIYVFCLLFLSCRNSSEDIPHKGTIRLEACLVQIDTMMVSLEDASGMGNYYMRDSVITFVDAVTSVFYDIDLNGNITSSYFRKGNGKNEIPSLLYAYPIGNDPYDRAVILDNSNGVTLFEIESKNIVSRGIADFGWEQHHTKSYRLPELYNFSFFTDFGVSFYLDPDSKLLFQANIVNRNTTMPDEVEKRRYIDGAVLGRLNMETNEVEEVFGYFPDIYESNPMPHLEFFQYVIQGDKLYMNHTVDSLIYVYQYPDTPLYTFGYECRDIDRSYTVTKKIDNSTYFKKDLEHVGFNTGLQFIPELNVFCRTYIKSAATGEAGMQIYKDYDLIADIDVPVFFKLLGYCDGCFYGSSFVPIETTNKTSIIIYRLKITSLSNNN